MPEKLKYNASQEEVGNSLMHTLSLIKEKGETKELKYDMLFKYGRFNFLENKLEKAYDIFQQCSIHGIDNNILDMKELYYWSARCLEAMGEKIQSLNCYLMLLERKHYIENDTKN